MLVSEQARVQEQAPWRGPALALGQVAVEGLVERAVEEGATWRAACTGTQDRGQWKGTRRSNIAL